MIKGIAHACYTVSDMEATLAFYCEGLGLQKAFDYRDEQGHLYGAYVYVGGRTFVEFFEGELAERAEKQAYSHLCLEVDDLEATVAELEAKGISTTPIKRGKDRSYQSWINDPDGNRIELHDYTPESKQTLHLNSVGN